MAVNRYLLEFNHRTIEYSQVDLEKLNIAIPCFDRETGTYHLVVFSVEELKEFGDSHLQYSKQFIETLYDADCEYINREVLPKWNPRSRRIPHIFARPDIRSVLLASRISENDMLEGKLGKPDYQNLGAVYSAINHVGYVIYDGNYCAFPFGLVNFIKPFRIKEIVDILEDDGYIYSVEYAYNSVTGYRTFK